MGEEVVLFSSEEHTDTERVAAFLRELADKLVEGTVVLSGGSSGDVTLAVPQNVVLEVEVEEEREDDTVEYSLEVEIEWTEGGDEGGQVTLG